MDQGEEPVADQELTALLRRRARLLYLYSALGGAVLTVACWLLKVGGDW